MKKALITGITGQDGSYLAEFLLSKGYEVHGLIRRASTFNTQRIEHLYVDPHVPDKRLFLHYSDLTDSGQISNLIFNILPDEVYHLGAQSHVRVSFDLPVYTSDVVALGTTRILEAIKCVKKKIKFYQASSSEMFGKAVAPQSELTAFEPRSPYACAKLYAYWITENYRTGYDIFACNGILFNHESPRRGETFVTRKISRAVARIAAGEQSQIYLGNLDAKRDWGYAPEYVEAMWLMLQEDSPGDFVIGTEQSHTVREFVEGAFDYVGVKLSWKGEGVEEVGVVEDFKENAAQFETNLQVGDKVVLIDPKYFRPTEVNYLLADASKAKCQLNWQAKVSFEELVKIMVDYDLALINQKPIGQGIKVSNEKGYAWTKHSMN